MEIEYPYLVGPGPNVSKGLSLYAFKDLHGAISFCEEYQRSYQKCAVQVDFIVGEVQPEEPSGSPGRAKQVWPKVDE